MCSPFFYRAMTHWQLGAKEEAVTWYRQGVARMEELKRNEATLLALRAETEALLGDFVIDPSGPTK